MNTGERGQLPPDLVRARIRFQAWRGRRKAGAPIPQGLWDLAIRLANVHGVSRTATLLRLDYYRLKKLADKPAGEPRASRPTFVEFTAPVAVAKRCRFEFDNGSGATLRVQLVGYDAADIEALSRGFWGAL
jgi:hypothetical protein